MDDPIPWPDCPIFADWAHKNGVENINGFMGYRMTAEISPNRMETDNYIEDVEHAAKYASVYLKAAVIASGGQIGVTREQIMAMNIDLEIDGDGVGDVIIRAVSRQ